jgi:protein-tyrosine phosphatase
MDASSDPLTQRTRGVVSHRYTRFDVPFVSEIAHNLWQGGAREGLVLPDDIAHVVSLHPWESYIIRHSVRSVLKVVMQDTEDEPLDRIDGIADWG